MGFSTAWRIGKLWSSRNVCGLFCSLVLEKQSNFFSQEMHKNFEKILPDMRKSAHAYLLQPVHKALKVGSLLDFCHDFSRLFVPWSHHSKPDVSFLSSQICSYLLLSTLSWQKVSPLLRLDLLCISYSNIFASWEPASGLISTRFSRCWTASQMSSKMFRVPQSPATR